MDDVAFTNEEKATIDALRLKYTRDDTRQPADVVDVLGGHVRARAAHACCAVRHEGTGACSHGAAHQL